MCNSALELVLKVCSWQTPSAWHGSSLKSLSPTQMSWIRSSEVGLRWPTHAHLWPPLPWKASGKRGNVLPTGSLIPQVVCSGSAEGWRQSWGWGRQASPSWACPLPRLGGAVTDLSHPGPKGSPGSVELPFGMWLLRETSTLPLFLVMLCYHHRQSCRTESPSRIKGATKADHPGGPEGQRRAGLVAARETGLWERKSARDGLLGLPGCPWPRAETQLTYSSLLWRSQLLQDTRPPWASLRNNLIVSAHLNISAAALPPSESAVRAKLCHCLWASVRPVGAFLVVPFGCQIGPQHHESRTMVIGKQGFAFCSSPYAPPRSQHTGLYPQGLARSTAKRRWGKTKNVWLKIQTFMYILEYISLHFPTACIYYILYRPWCWEGLGAGGEGDDRGRDGWMVSPTLWTWAWVNCRNSRPGVLWFMGSQRAGQDWATELNWYMYIYIYMHVYIVYHTCMHIHI